MIDKNAFLQFVRNERWGTCVDCPRDSEGLAYPEFCEYTNRSDHHLTIDDLVRIYKLHASSKFPQQKVNCEPL